MLVEVKKNESPRGTVGNTNKNILGKKQFQGDLSEDLSSMICSVYHCLSPYTLDEQKKKSLSPHRDVFASLHII